MLCFKNKNHILSIIVYEIMCKYAMYYIKFPVSVYKSSFNYCNAINEPLTLP